MNQDLTPIAQATPDFKLSARPPQMDLGAFGYFFEDGKHLWAYKEKNWWFNQIRMDDKLLTGDVGDWRSGRSIAYGLHEVIAGRADQEILCHFNPRVLAHIKSIASDLLEASNQPLNSPLISN